ncbi:MAG: NAD(P)/FAD-dependent oxidoreductase [Candidatus Latescibacteria bacterium]|jgi:digeranylgeranylglycerophospholipid reductase|nr:NAD(P)/FAD-dependent oxidoreductase [Candidatus Latescibacterota bacterium]
MKHFDMVAIGGGPAGSMAALTAAKLDLSVLLVERDPDIGIPVRCAEGVDVKGLSQFFQPDPKWISAEINSYYLVAPDGSKVKMLSGLDSGLILERSVFDRMIAHEAALNGARVMTGIEAVAMTEYTEGLRTVTLRSDEKEWDVRARVVIAADGVESRVARWAGLKTRVGLDDMETCAQMTLANIDIDQHAFSLYYSSKFAPEGYAWVFPKGRKIANVGLGISGNFAKQKTPVQRLEEFREHYFPETSIVSRTIGGIPCTGGIEKIYADGVMVCGDSAQMANPITGGGIINGMIAGQFAGETAAEVLSKGGAEEKRLRIYRKRCDDRFGKMNRRFYRIKESIITLSDNRLNEIAHKILETPVEKRTPIKVLRSALLKEPGLLRLLPKLLI